MDAHFTLSALSRVILVTSTVTLFYMLSVGLSLPPGWILGSLLSAMMTVVWMVIRVLKAPSTTHKTCEECFYQDRPDIGPGSER
jgi:hypothetical protein